MPPLPRNALLLLSVAAAFAGCAHARRPAAVAAPAAIEFTEPVAQANERPTALTRPSLHKAYYVGRIVDVRYPDLMHGAGVVFRRERAETWDTAPTTTAAGAFMAGPIRSLRNGSELGEPTEADKEIYEARTDALIDALIEQNNELMDKLAAAETNPTPASPGAGETIAIPPLRPNPEPASPGAPVAATAEGESLVTIAPSADDVIELSPALLEPSMPGLTNPFRQRYQFETQLREIVITVSGISLGPQPSCVIGERIYNVGDAFDSFTVAAITPDGVYLRKGSFLLHIPMQEKPIKLRFP